MGLRQLENATASLAPEQGIQAHYESEPFLLNPSGSIPDEGEDMMEHLAKAYGGPNNVRADVLMRMARHESPLQLGHAVGIQFTTKRKIYPTVMAHALMEHVKQSYSDYNTENKANRIMEALFKSYFEQGANINNVETLADIAAQCISMDKEEAKQACSNADLLHRVRQKDADHKTKNGISGVPFFIFHNPNNNSGMPTITLSGAQPAEVLAQHIKKAASSSSSSK
jgi:predicted DsbA family dithiol-disulfide isomerase